jgi:hypothetical protein
MAIDFPSNPTNGQQFTSGGVTWTWDGTKWTAGASGVAYLPLVGGTMQGPIVLATDPAASLQAATKQYVDGVRWGDNRIINGDMRIDQRNNGAATTPAAGANYVVDRWQYVAAQAGKFSFQRQPFGQLGSNGYCLVASVPAAYASLASDYFLIQQKIEGFNVFDLNWGASPASPVTLSFWAHSDKAGTHSGAISNGATNRSYPFTFTLAANTWAKIVVTIPGDTAGTWTIDNSASLTVIFNLGSGSTLLGPAGAWAGVQYVGATGSVNIVSTTSSHLYLTEVKLEIGSVATPFNRQSLAKSMADCQRYYQVISTLMTITNYAPAGFFYQPMALPVTMRSAPTIVLSNFSNVINCTSSTAAALSSSSMYTSATVTATGTASYRSDVNLSAEL